MRRGENTGDINEHSYSYYLESDKPVFIIDKKGTLVRVNDIFCETLGVSREELLGVPLEDTGVLTPEARGQVMRRHLSRLVGKEALAYTLDVLTKNRDVLSFEIEVKPVIKNKENVGEINIVQNIIGQRYARGQPRITRVDTGRESHNEFRSIDGEHSFERVQEKAQGFTRRYTDPEDLDELYADIDSREQEIHAATKKWLASQAELEDKNYAFRCLQNDFKRLRRRAELRDREFDELVETLYKSQRELEDKTSEITHLQQVVQQKYIALEPRRETPVVERGSKQKELGVAPFHLQIENQELLKLRQQVENINVEMEKRELSADWSRTELEALKEQLLQSQNALHEKNRWIEQLQTTLDQKQRALDVVTADLEIRNEILDEVEKRLEENRIVLFDNNHALKPEGTPDHSQQDFYVLKEQYSQLDEENRELKIAVENLLEKIEL